MAKTRRGTASRAPRALTPDDEPAGSGDFIGQIGLFETANGMPHGPLAIVAAIVAAIAIYPISRFVRFLTRR